MAAGEGARINFPYQDYEGRIFKMEKRSLKSIPTNREAGQADRRRIVRILPRTDFAPVLGHFRPENGCAPV